MIKHIPSLEKLIRQLQHVPYLASKNLYRVASHFLSSDQKSIDQLCRAIIEAKEKVKPCKNCFNWTQTSDLCAICADSKRDRSSICVVETWHDLLAIERTQDYDGLYHVLGGSLCPLEGVGPDDLTVDAFLTRIDDGIKEVIFATNPTPEGEATASFVASKLEGASLLVSRLASGIPIGYSLEQMDRVTIHKAIAGRRPF
ncbi:recombination mediator RecR [Candidatus Dependentiae bacterium]|nr:recombination mediator RecR [Candidatus Dependentiae bacterium]